jgi:hypothetical protein
MGMLDTCSANLDPTAMTDQLVAVVHHVERAGVRAEEGGSFKFIR